MSTKDTSDTAEEVLPDDIQPAQELNGLPLFIANDSVSVENIMKAAENQDIDFYYILAEKTEKIEEKSQYTNHITNIRYESYPRLFRVTTNFIGQSIKAVENGTVQLDEIVETAYFNLPSIPWDLICDVDTFFRKIDDELGTEAVVLFIYDPAFLDADDPSEGWGIIVPEQRNTAGSCKYDPTSIIEDKPDDAYLVGSAHSHPGMSAFCSGTDARDQADFDGIHITFGWKNFSQQTDFYIELQMAGVSYVMKPESVFSEMPEREEKEAISAWTKKVKKEPLGATSAYSSYYGYGEGSSFWSSDPDFSDLPKECPTPREATLVIFLDKDSENFSGDCPACKWKLGTYSLSTLECSRCAVFFAFKGMTYNDLLKTREKERKTTYNLEPTSKPRRAIWVWEQNPEGDNQDVLYCLYSPHETDDTLQLTKDLIQRDKDAEKKA